MPVLGTNFQFDFACCLPYTNRDKRTGEHSADGLGRARNAEGRVRRRRCKLAEALRQKDPNPTKLWKAEMHRRGNPPENTIGR